MFFLGDSRNNSKSYIQFNDNVEKCAYNEILEKIGYVVNCTQEITRDNSTAKVCCDGAENASIVGCFILVVCVFHSGRLPLAGCDLFAFLSPDVCFS